MVEFIISGLGDEVSMMLSEQMDTFEKLGIKYIETRGVNGLNDYYKQCNKEQNPSTTFQLANKFFQDVLGKVYEK